MSGDNNKKKFKLRFEATPAKSGEQYHFNIPSYLIKNKKINVNKQYWIDFVEKGKEYDKVAKGDPLEQILPYIASPAKSGEQYHFIIPSFLIRNKYFDPKKDTKYWVYYRKIEEEN
jgi:hypothetical protein